MRSCGCLAQGRLGRKEREAHGAIIGAVAPSGQALAIPEKEATDQIAITAPAPDHSAIDKIAVYE